MFNLSCGLSIILLYFILTTQASEQLKEEEKGVTKVGVFTGAEGMINGWQLISWQGDVFIETTNESIAKYEATGKTDAELNSFKSAMAKYNHVISTRFTEWGGVSIQKANNKKSFNTYRFSVFVPQEESCDFSFNLLIKSNNDVLKSSYRASKRGEWNTFEYSAKNPFTPTQLEFQKTDATVCNTYFTELVLGTSSTDDSTDSTSQSEDSASAQIVSVLVIGLSLLSIFIL